MDKEQKAIERIKIASELSFQHYGLPLICTYSGGKDSEVLLALIQRAGIPFEVQHSHTTVDAPPTVYHIRKTFRALELNGVKAIIQKPTYKKKPCTMWSLILEKEFPPTRLQRYCCQILKETSGKNRFIATGVRWDESKARTERDAYESFASNKKKKVTVSDEIMLMNDNGKKRKLMEHCQLKGKMVVNPIIDWTHLDIWEYIHSNHIVYNPLYDRGYERVGCIGCPLAGKKRYKEFADYPSYKQMYILTFDKMIAKRKECDWKTGEDVFRWWMEDKGVNGQLSFCFEKIK